MASIDVGTASHKRDPNRELALVPFIDFLLCLVAFLLVTAVWSTQSRMDANAKVPGEQTCCTPPEKPKALHVTVRDQKFELNWREGETVVASSDVARRPVVTEAGDVRFPDLANAVAKEWATHGAHRAPTDKKRDTAVLHAPNSLAYAELIAVLDAVGSAKRSPAQGQEAFAVSFAVD